MSTTSNASRPPLYVPRAVPGPGAEPLGEVGDQIPALLDNVVASIELYAREKPWNFGLWMAGVGFVLGWKLKFF